jgi:magnesium-transporting ATPase (P-type)
VTISTEDLVVGDVVLITAGNTVPADCLVFESVNISTDESALTGEPEELKKFAVTADNVDNNAVPLVLRSTLCATGSGKAIVCCVGPNTMSGRAEQILTMEADQTPLQKKLATIADQIGKLGMAVALMTFVAMVVRTIINVYVTNPDTEKKGGVIGQSILDALIIAVTVVVVAVPEGLPLAVTISLAFSVSKMYKE